MNSNLPLFVGGDESDFIKIPKFPTTRYQGSKRKILGEMAVAFSKLKFSSVLDLYSGTASVSLLLRYMGKKVHANDYLIFNKSVAELFLKVNGSDIKLKECSAELFDLLNTRSDDCGDLVERKYSNIFFKDDENRQIDQFCSNIQRIEGIRKHLYIYAVGQALMKKRPYNLFHRANLHMRTKDVKRSFGNAVTWETSIYEHALKAIEEVSKFPFASSMPLGSTSSFHAKDLNNFSKDYDLVYLDPPYLNSKSVETDYSNFYGFLNGLCQYELFDEGDESYAHKPLLKPNSGWESEEAALVELNRVRKYFDKSIIVLSYRSDGVPTERALKESLSLSDCNVQVGSFGDFKYALSKTDTNEELYLISYPSI